MKPPDSDTAGLPEPIPTFARLAEESRDALEGGRNFYVLERDPLHIEPSHGPRHGAVENLRVCRSIPWRGFRVSRSPGEYHRKLTVNPRDWVELLTRDRHQNAHCVLELGAGQGRVLRFLKGRGERDEDLQGRNIRCYGECDQLYFKLTVLIRSYLGKKFDAAVEGLYGVSSGDDEVKREFAMVLTMFLTQNEDLFEEDITTAEAAMNRMLEPGTWEGLLDRLDGGEIRGVHRADSDDVYEPPRNMRQLLEAFVEDPSAFLAYRRESGSEARSPHQQPRSRLGIESARLILGGDMRDFIDTIPDASLSAVLGVRSTVYLVKDAESDRGIVPFGFKVARKLRRGGGWIDDWPRGNYDATHHVSEAVALHHLLQADPELRDEIKMYLVWGPSEEFPDDHPCVPVAMVMLRKDPDGRTPVREIQDRLMVKTLVVNGVVRSVEYTLIPVTDDADARFRAGKIDPAITLTRGRLADRLQRLVRTMRRGTRLD